MGKMENVRKWLDNFWYHHKWQTIFIAFIVMVVVICMMQMGSQIEYDAKILYVGPHFFDAEQKANVESAFAQILEKDYNEDDKKNGLLADLTILTAEQLTEVLNQTPDDPTALAKYGQYSEDARKQSFAQEIAVGENVICLLDPYWYDQIVEKEGLASLSSVLGYKPEGAIDDYGIYLKDTDFGKFFDVFDELPDDTILCIRVLSASMLAGGAERAQDRYEQHEEIFRSVMAFRLPEGFEEKESA